jgi:60 kDa SS-A/Ro ribonucleoprotein
MQPSDRDDILNVGGFSDAVFSVVVAFLADDSGRFVAEVDAVGL